MKPKILRYAAALTFAGGLFGGALLWSYDVELALVAWAVTSGVALCLLVAEEREYVRKI